jgi:transcription elongation GreA/GreB family factor
VIPANDRVAPDAGTVAIGTLVTLYDLRTGDTVEYAITRAHAAAGPGTASAISPVGEAVLGRRPGDVVEVELPRGRIRELEVLAVRPPVTSAEYNLIHDSPAQDADPARGRPHPRP